MKQFKIMLRMFTVLAILALFTLPAAAEDLNVYPTETTSSDFVSGDRLMALISSDPVPTFSISDEGLTFVIGYEGFLANPYWDVTHFSIGYGCSYDAAKALFGEDCAPITEEQAFQLLKSEATSVENYLNKYLTKNSISLNQNQFDALMSFTYNVGISWLYKCNPDGTPYKIQAMLLDDPTTWTEARAQEAFGSWVNADGKVLPGLVKRRAAEAKLFCTPYTASDDNTETDLPESETESVPEVVFSDVKESDWFYSTVNEVYDLGLMNGVGGGLFNPADSLTRAQMVQILANFDGVTDLSNETDTAFADVPAGQWYTGVVAWAAEKEYVLGMDDGTFHPNDPITREQMCTILTRYLKAKGFATGGEVTVFSDDAAISGYAKEGVYFCSTLGLILGMGDGTFSPGTYATRAQAATILLRMYALS